MHIHTVANFNKIVASSCDVTENSCQVFQNPAHLLLQGTFSNSKYLVASKIASTASYYNLGVFS